MHSCPLGGRRVRRLRFVLAASCFAACGFLAACGDVPIDQKYPQDRLPGDTKPRYEDPESIFGGKGLFLGGDQTAAAGGAQAGTIGVNSLLWRASLDTLSFMPLSSADPFGGVIITEWYSAPENPNEQMKVTVYILDKRLRADALKVSVFRQTRSATGWVDAQVNPETAAKLENAILSRARQLRLNTVEQ